MKNIIIMQTRYGLAWDGNLKNINILISKLVNLSERKLFLSLRNS